MISGFISALFSFGQRLAGQDVSTVRLGPLSLFIDSKSDLIFAVAVDDDDTNMNRTKLGQIMEIFMERYAVDLSAVQSDYSDTNPFQASVSI